VARRPLLFCRRQAPLWCCSGRLRPPLSRVEALAGSPEAGASFPVVRRPRRYVGPPATPLLATAGQFPCGPAATTLCWLAGHSSPGASRPCCSAVVARLGLLSPLSGCSPAARRRAMFPLWSGGGARGAHDSSGEGGLVWL
jgi:hypothetical protein